MARTKKEEATTTEPQAEEQITPKAKNECACGCGRETGRTFAQGHDSKVYSILKKVQRGEAEPEAVPVAVRQDKELLERMMAKIH